MSSEIFLEC